MTDHSLSETAQIIRLQSDIYRIDSFMAPTSEENECSLSPIWGDLIRYYLKIYNLPNPFLNALSAEVLLCLSVLPLCFTKTRYK